MKQKHGNVGLGRLKIRAKVGQIAQIVRSDFWCVADSMRAGGVVAGVVWCGMPADEVGGAVRGGGYWGVDVGFGVVSGWALRGGVETFYILYI